MGTRKYYEQDYLNLASDRGFVWLETVSPLSSHTATLWQCKEGHKWSSSFTYMKRGKGCPVCGNKRKGQHNRITKEQYKKLADKNNLIWLDSELPKDTRTHSKWLCSNGHTFNGSYNNIQNGHGCFYCSHIVPKTEKDYQSMSLINPVVTWSDKTVPKSINHKTKWRCSLGHIWEASYHNVIKGSSCPICYNLVKIARCKAGKYTELHYYAVAEKAGIRWLGPLLPNNNNTPTLWECSNKHQWKTSRGNIQQGSRCPTCRNYINGIRASKEQIEIAYLIQGELNYKKGRKIIDIALPNENIAIEYDSWYWHASRHEQDAARYSKLINSGWKILRIKSNYKLPSKETLEKNINLLKSGIPYIEIILDDWAVGAHR